MRQFSYLAMLLAVLACTVPMERFPGARVLRRPRRLLATLGTVFVPFVAWDAFATEAGHWSFDSDQTVGVRVLGLPLEELAFFLVIPLAVIYTVEAVRAILERRR